MSQLDMYPAMINSPQTELAADIDDVQNEIELLDVAALPIAPNLAVIGSDETAETVLYTGITDNTLTGVTRGFQGTSKSWSAGQKVYRGFTAYDADAMRGNIEDHESRVSDLESGFSDVDDDVDDIRTPDPSYTPQREINVAGDMTRDMQAQFVAHRADYDQNAVRKNVRNTFVERQTISRNDTTPYDGSATDGQLDAGATLFVQQNGGSNAALAQIVLQPRGGQPYNRIVASGGTSPFLAFVVNNRELLRITDAGKALLLGQELDAPQKTALFGFSPERLSATVLRIFPGYCTDVGNTAGMQSDNAIDIDTTVTGLNGLDTGTITVGTAYYPYIIKNPTTGVVGAVLSKEISASLVTRPTGFTLIRKLPWGYVQRPEGIPNFHITAWPLPFTRFTDTDDSSAWAALTDGSATTLSSFSLSNFIPDNSRVAYLLCKVTSAGSAGGAWLRSLGSGGNGIPVGYVNGANDISYVYMQIRTTSQLQLSYKVSGGARLTVYVAGYVQTERS